MTEARDTVPIINALLASPKISVKVATQDYHPSDHISFASNHEAPNNKPFESFVDMKNLVADKPEEVMKTRLWPVHCVQGTRGVDLIDELDTAKVDIFVKKGMDARVEMYSAFADSFGNLTAGKGGVSHDLAKELKEKGVKDVLVTGVAGDYCVKYTAIDAAKAGFDVYLIEEAQRCVDAKSWEDIKPELEKEGVKIVSVKDEQVQNLLVR